MISVSELVPPMRSTVTASASIRLSHYICIVDAAFICKVDASDNLII